MVLKPWSPSPAASAASGDLLKTQIIGTHSSPTEAETVGVGPRNVGFNKLILTNISKILTIAKV